MTIFNQVHDIKRRRLEISSELAEIRRTFFVDGIEGDRAHKSMLEAESANLALDLHDATGEIIRQKTHAVLVRGASLNAILIQKMHDAGMASEVEEARRESIAKLADVGLLDAFKS